MGDFRASGLRLESASRAEFAVLVQIVQHSGQADAQHLPFPSDTFQIATVAFGLRNVTDTDKGIAEMARVTQPGGKVAILEFYQPRGIVMGPLTQPPKVAEAKLPATLMDDVVNPSVNMTP